MALYVTYLGHVIHNKTLCAIKNGACRSQHVGHNTTLCNVPDHKASFCTRHQTTVTTRHCAICQTTKLHFAPDTRPQSQYDTVQCARPPTILHFAPDQSLHDTTPAVHANNDPSILTKVCAAECSGGAAGCHCMGRHSDAHASQIFNLCGKARSTCEQSVVASVVCR